MRRLTPILGLGIVATFLLCSNWDGPELALSAPAPQLIQKNEPPKSSISEPEYLPQSAHALYYDLTELELDAILSDAKDRIHPQFHIPKSLKPLVGFWFRIYAKYSSHQIVLFDEHFPEIIYEVQDDRDLFSAGKSAIQIELNSKARRSKLISEYKAAFAKLAANPKTKFKSGTAGARILAVWGRRKSSHWNAALGRLRSQRGQRDFVMRGIQASEPFMPAMERIFADYGLPTELTKIPLLESSFMIDAASKASAVGVWQFLEGSGREYMLIDKKLGIDERLSPIKAAVGAAKMFRRNMRLLDDYALAIIAYNHGPRNLVRLRRAQKVINIQKLLDPSNKNSPLGFASRNYYAEFLAMLYAERYRTEIYSLSRSSHHYEVDLVKLQKPMTVFEVAAKYNADLNEIRRFNPDVFKIQSRIPVGISVVIPRRVYRSYVTREGAPAREPSRENVY